MNDEHVQLMCDLKLPFEWLDCQLKLIRNTVQFTLYVWNLWLSLKHKGRPYPVLKLFKSVVT